MSTKFSSDADKLMRSFNMISTNLGKISKNIDDLDLDQIKGRMELSINSISSILNDESIINDIEDLVFNKINEISNSGFFSNIISNKKKKDR